jgi:hypothetical protein
MPVERLNGMVAASLVLLMILGSLVLWLAVPLAWLWLASQIDGSLDASLKAYATVAVGVPTTMLALFWLLRQVDAAHQQITGSAPSKRLAPAWRRSLSEERDLHAPTSALDTILAATAIVALIALAVWFFLFAGSPLPSSPV